MSDSHPALRARRATRPTIVATLVIITALTCVAGCQSLAGSSSAASPTVAEPPAHISQQRLPGEIPAAPPEQAAGNRHGVLDVSGGEVPDGVMVFDDTYPAVAKLDPGLLRTLRTAAKDAGGDGVELYVNSGWRSPAYQEQLLDEAVAEYGSRAEAARWVATPTTSPHVSGDAVDIGGANATGWLSEHGAVYGLCQIYRNEPWHYELRPGAVDHGCPPMYADPTHDPRMQQ